MFKNVGRKLKIIAVISFVINFIGLVTIGIIAITGDVEMPLLGASLIFAGVFVSPVIAFFIYGFGILVENAEEETKERKKGRVNQEIKTGKIELANNETGDSGYIDKFCIKCGSRLKDTDQFCVKCGWRVES